MHPQYTCAFPGCNQPFTPNCKAQRFCSKRCNARNRAANGTLAPNPRKLPPFEELAPLYESGLSCTVIAAQFSVGPSSVQRALAAGGMTLRPSWIDGAKTRTGRTGPAHNAFKGERKVYSGYVLIYRPDHPRCSESGYVREHRLVVEEALGRFLRPDEIVHHINKDTQDNRLENLRVMARTDHGRLHNTLADWKAANPEAMREQSRRGARAANNKRWGH